MCNFIKPEILTTAENISTIHFRDSDNQVNDEQGIETST